jgi:hypothetical protein
MLGIAAPSKRCEVAEFRKHIGYIPFHFPTIEPLCVCVVLLMTLMMLMMVMTRCIQRC